MNCNAAEKSRHVLLLLLSWRPTNYHIIIIIELWTINPCVGLSAGGVLSLPLLGLVLAAVRFQPAAVILHRLAIWYLAWQQRPVLVGLKSTRLSDLGNLGLDLAKG